MATNTTSFTVTFTGPNNASVGGTFSFTGDFVVNWAILAPIGTNTSYVMPTVTKADVNGFGIVADQACTIANATSSPTFSLTMLAGIPVIWYTGSNYSN